MELGIREWLITFIVLLTLYVIFDGFRRAHKERKQVVKMKRKVERSKYSREDDLSLSELPNGGNKRVASSKTEPSLFADSPLDFNDPLFVDPFKVGANSQTETVADEEVLQETVAVEQPMFDDIDDADETDLQEEPQEILIVHVVASQEQGFAGADLFALLKSCDCRLGAMSIFHRFEEANGKGAMQFSVANLVKPGSFSNDSSHDFFTPGITLFMRLPGPERPMEAFDTMVEVAQCVAKNLNGSLKDEQHSTMTEQTLQHSRQRIRDYLQRTLLQNG